MSRQFTLCLASLLIAVAWAAITMSAEPVFRQPPITVADGYRVEIAAAPPLVGSPMMAGFDERGRLFIAESTGLNLRPNDLEAKLPNFIRMLEDTDGDGRFDRSTIFADRMTQPMGALWHDGALYVASPPSIWRLEDTDGDGIADRRDELVTKFGYNGNAASIHGCFLGPGGRIYWTDGRHGHEFVDADGRTLSQGKAARIFSCRTDGNDVQVHCGGGMDNPVEVDFTPEGEMLGTVNIMFRKRGDCLVHWMRGGVYPRYDQQSCLDEFPRTGDPLMPVSNVGHVAISGVMRYRGTHLGTDYQNNFFHCEFNTHKIVRTILTREGSTFAGKQEDFLVSSSVDFHPTDVLEDADGSLLVVDTGGWFRIGCPTSQIAKPEIPGAIYRVRRVDATPAIDPRGLKLAWKNMTAVDLTGLLDDDRFVVRQRAIDTLAQAGDDAVAALDKAIRSSEERTRRNAVWALGRIGTESARALLRGALEDEALSVRLAAVRAAGTLGDAAAVAQLSQLANSAEGTVRRAAATALGQIGQASSVPSLLTALALRGDRVEEHAIIYALIEIDAPQQTLAGLSSPSPDVRRGALVALDQMPSGALTRELVVPLLDTEDVALERAALEVIARHEGWAGEIVERARGYLSEKQIPADRLAALRGALVAFAADAEIQSLVAQSLSNRQTPPETRRLLLEVIARSDLETLPKAWSAELSSALEAANPEVARQAVATIAAQGGARFDGQLRKLAANNKKPVELRVAALGTIAARNGALESGEFDLLLSRLDEDLSPIDRLAAANALGRAKLTAAQLAALADLVDRATPLELPALAAAFEHSSDDAVGLKFVAALGRSPGATSLSGVRLRKLLSSYGPKVQASAAPLLEQIDVGLKEQMAKLESLKPATQGGDPERGKQIFFSKRAACFACHRIGTEGGNVGPDLSTIGKIRTRRDLLEAVVIPSASFARGFETYTVATDDGMIYTGVISREAAGEIHLRTPQRAEVRIARSRIDEIAPSVVSVMPQGLEKIMSPGELRDLLAFLSSLKK